MLLIDRSQALSSVLRLNIDEKLDVLLEQDIPQAIYKEFGHESHRENFLNGNIWFSGVSQNRFFLGDEKRRDINEYRNEFGSHIFDYAMSFTTVPPSSGNPIIKVSNVEGFMHGIVADIESLAQEDFHRVTWCSLNDLRRYIDLVPAIAMIEKYPEREDEIVELYAWRLAGGYVVYEEKIKDLKNGYNSIAVANNAHNKDVGFLHENEWRISLCTGDFLPPYGGNSLHHLVEYLKLKCPSVSKYCIAI